MNYACAGLVMQGYCQLDHQNWAEQYFRESLLI